MNPTTPATLEAPLFKEEPSWLRDRRRSALDAYERLPMPSRTDEEWRRTDIAGLNPSKYAHLEQVLAHSDMAPNLPDGVIFEPLSIVAAKKHADLVMPKPFTLLHADRDKFAALHAAFFTGGHFLYVPDGVVIDRPLLAENYSYSSGTTVMPHTLIIAGKNSRLNFLDEHIAKAGDESG